MDYFNSNLSLNDLKAIYAVMVEKGAPTAPAIGNRCTFARLIEDQAVKNK